MSNESKPASLQHEKGDDGSHVVVLSLHVLVAESDGYWFAHGLEVDFAASGGTADEAKDHFTAGLRATISENLRVYGHLKQLMLPAPAEIWMEFTDAVDKWVFQTVIFERPHHDARPKFAYDRLVFAEDRAA